ncbi:uncharacterized protein LOC132640089 [Lycium barbarum]|uniref:uncharacterized protein LOC132640089 n=1 Tax=Lycium barbarum TaxID=112863 RepID=UPI00293EC2D8|nr:uncharacterized protein LOC132640089 [Lycium barbarum]
MLCLGCGNMKIAEEVRQQFNIIPGLIKTHVNLDYATLVKISINESIEHIISPGAFVVLMPLIVGIFVGVETVFGGIAGTFSSGVPIEKSALETGGARDNAKVNSFLNGLVADKQPSSLKHDMTSYGRASYYTIQHANGVRSSLFPIRNIASGIMQLDVFWSIYKERESGKEVPPAHFVNAEFISSLWRFCVKSSKGFQNHNQNFFTCCGYGWKGASYFDVNWDKVSPADVVVSPSYKIGWQQVQRKTALKILDLEGQLCCIQWLLLALTIWTWMPAQIVGHYYFLLASSSLKIEASANK